MRIGQPTSVARLNIDETITGLWSFANALGLLTDDIGERTGGAGVTVDGLLIRDAGVPEAVITAHEAALAILESQVVDAGLLARLAAAETITGIWQHDALVRIRATLVMDNYALATTRIIGASVTGDSNDRWFVNAAGTLLWGSGAAGGDTNLFRAAAGELETADDFNVGGVLDLAGALECSVQLTTVAAQLDDFDLGGKTIQGMVSSANRDVTGFAGGVDGKIVMVQNRNSTFTITLKHSDSGSVTGNRFVLEGNVDKVLAARGGIILYYDADLTKWAPLS